MSLNILIVIRPVLHGNGQPVSDTITSVSFQSDEESSEEESEKDDSAELLSDPNFDETHFSRPMPHDLFSLAVRLYSFQIYFNIRRHD